MQKQVIINRKEWFNEFSFINCNLKALFVPYLPAFFSL